MKVIHDEKSYFHDYYMNNTKELSIFSRRFSKKNTDYSSDFFKTNELTDFINFISKH